MAIDPKSPPISSLWPKERGAYAQLGITILAGLSLARPGVRAIIQGLLSLAVFLASEPVMVLLGRRGDRPRRSEARRASARLALLGLLALIAAATAWIGASPGEFASLILPTALTISLFCLFLAKHEHTPAGEWLTAWAMASATYPLAILGGAVPSKAFKLFFLLGGVLSVGMTVVRGHLLSLKPRNTFWPRSLPALLGLLFLSAMTVFALNQRLPWIAALCGLPVTLLALEVWIRPQPSRPLKTLGWLLASTSAMGAAIAVAGLR